MITKEEIFSQFPDMKLMCDFIDELIIMHRKYGFTIIEKGKPYEIFNIKGIKGYVKNNSTNVNFFSNDLLTIQDEKGTVYHKIEGKEEILQRIKMMLQNIHDKLYELGFECMGENLLSRRPCDGKLITYVDCYHLKGTIKCTKCGQVITSQADFIELINNPKLLSHHVCNHSVEFEQEPKLNKNKEYEYHAIEHLCASKYEKFMAKRLLNHNCKLINGDDYAMNPIKYNNAINPNQLTFVVQYNSPNSKRKCDFYEINTKTVLEIHGQGHFQLCEFADDTSYGQYEEKAFKSMIRDFTKGEKDGEHYCCYISPINTFADIPNFAKYIRDNYECFLNSLNADKQIRPWISDMQRYGYLAITNSDHKDAGIFNFKPKRIIEALRNHFDKVFSDENCFNNQEAIIEHLKGMMPNHSLFLCL